MNITIIGNGKMAVALAQGLKQTYNITIISRSISKIDGVSYIPFDKSIDITNQNILLCVKPYALKDVSSKLTGQANSIVSILAGTTLESLHSNISSKYYVRAMPNLAATNNQSITSLTGDLEFKDIALQLFDSIGKTIWLNTQKELDIATAIAGSGPAFLALVAEGLSDGGVNSGLKREDSNFLVQGLFKSFVSLLEKNSPSQIKDAVMSPGGTTSAGVTSLEQDGVRSAFIQAISSAKDRADKLSKI